jgi:Na+/citrate or Na+/malate symporter
MAAAGAVAAELELDPEYRKDRDTITLARMGSGLFIATGFFILGALINTYIPAIHGYAWMILPVALIKALGLLPRKFEISCYQWFQFVMNNLTGVLLAGIGVACTDVAVLSAAGRMELMPFAQISSRLGGAFMLILSSLLLRVLF